MAPAPPNPSRAALGEVARLFLKLGTVAFGGPAAHVAMMEDEVVRRRGWIPREEFLDLLGATHLIPGPNSTELAIHLGYRRAGTPGLVAAGVAFILPAAAITAALAWAYVRLGSLPQLEGVLYGVKPVVIAVVVQALAQLGRTAVKSAPLGVLGLAAAAAVAVGVHELLVLAAAALLSGLAARGGRPGRHEGSRACALSAWAPGLGLASIAAPAAGAPAGLGPLFLVFAKIGAVLFGSGYVLLAFLRADLVERRGWLTETQLLDAVAVGQVTPGPVFSTATFVGYLLRGLPGAAVATVGIFVPAFLFVALSGPLVPRLRRSPTAGRVLDGVNVASLALMAVVAVQLARSALVDLPAVALALAGAVLLLRWRVNAAWLVAGGAGAGLVRSWVSP